MKKKRRKWLQHVIVFVLMFAMLMPMAAPISVQAAENDLYLAYQNTEIGKPVVQLKGASAKVEAILS
jgi:maltodextrin utilization protein YvdJ